MARVNVGMKGKSGRALRRSQDMPQHEGCSSIAPSLDFRAYIKILAFGRYPKKQLTASREAHGNIICIPLLLHQGPCMPFTCLCARAISLSIEASTSDIPPTRLLPTSPCHSTQISQHHLQYRAPYILQGHHCSTSSKTRQRMIRPSNSSVKTMRTKTRSHTRSLAQSRHSCLRQTSDHSSR